jgi:hypothetical protein
MSKTFLVEFKVELCCDECLEPVHAHLEICPCCQSKNASTDFIDNPFTCIGETFSCDRCGQEFRLVGESDGSFTIETIEGVNP